MDQPIISVVVPLYNCEKFIDRLAKSLLPQLSKEVELILIDDGSQDKTPELCDELANQNSHVRVMHQENAGPSVARNMGMAMAMGEYIAFVDGDDEIESNAYLTILKIIKTYYPDMIDFGWKYVSCTGEEVENKHKLDKDVLLDKEYIKNKIIPALIRIKDEEFYTYPFLWTRVIKRKLIVENGLTLDRTRGTWEDQSFIAECLKYAETYYAMDKALYRYIGTPNSLSTKYTVDYFRIIIENYNLYRKLFKDDYDFDTQYVYDYWSNAIHQTVFRALKQDSNFDKNRMFIDYALVSDEMQRWVKHSSKNTRFLKNISNAILCRDLEKVYDLYRKEYKARTKITFWQKIKQRIKAIQRKMNKHG